MTRQSLAAAASLLYGALWQRPLSRSLCVDDRLVRRWASGERPIPPWVDSVTGRLLTERKAAIEQMIEELSSCNDVTDVDAKCKTFC